MLFIRRVKEFYHQEIALSHRVAYNYAMFYSFFTTCKANKINPSLWLEEVLNRIPNQKLTI